MNRPAAIILAAGLAGAAALPSAAQDLTPLANLDLETADPTYAPLRCAALYQSSMEWTGEARLGPENVASLRATILQVVSWAAAARTEATGADETQAVLDDLRQLADIYLKRYQRNYEADGRAYTSDPVWQADAETCSGILGGSREQAD